MLSKTTVIAITLKILSTLSCWACYADLKLIAMDHFISTEESQILRITKHKALRLGGIAITYNAQNNRIKKYRDITIYCFL